MHRIFPIVLLFIGCVLLWFLYLNRSSSKIQEATIVIAGVVIAALFFVTKSENFEKTISSVYFVDLANKDFLSFHREPVLMHHYLQEGVILGQYFDRCKQLKKNSIFNFPEDHRPILDMQAISILQQLGTFYSGGWYIESSQTELPSYTKGSWGVIDEKDAVRDTKKYSKEDLPKSLRQNMFFDDLRVFLGLNVPNGTQISYEYDDKKGNYVEYRFYKRFSFDVKIKVHFSGYIVGLGTIGQYVGLVPPEMTAVDLRDENIKKYGTYDLIIKCSAEFSRLRAWDPSVVRYKKWAQHLFDSLYNRFDWSVQAKKIKEYEERVSRQKIIQKL